MEIKNLHYDGVARAYHAMVAFEHCGQPVQIPASVPAAMTLDPQRLAGLLASRALRKAHARPN